jgi:hypothetical protein
MPPALTVVDVVDPAVWTVVGDVVAVDVLVVPSGTVVVVVVVPGYADVAAPPGALVKYAIHMLIPRASTTKKPTKPLVPVRSNRAPMRPCRSPLPGRFYRPSLFVGN